MWDASLSACDSYLSSHSWYDIHRCRQWHWCFEPASVVSRWVRCLLRNILRACYLVVRWRVKYASKECIVPRYQCLQVALYKLLTIRPTGFVWYDVSQFVQYAVRSRCHSWRRLQKQCASSMQRLPRTVAPAPDRERGDLWWACLSLCVFVCPRSYLRNYTSDLHPIFVHVIAIWPWLGPPIWRRSHYMLCTSGL